MHPGRCACGKRACADLDQARYWRAWYALHSMAPVNQVFYYECTHGSWHWTRDITQRKNRAHV